MTHIRETVFDEILAKITEPRRIGHADLQLA